MARSWREGAGRFRWSRTLPVLWLALVWVLLWGRWSWGNLASGLILGVLVIVLLPLPRVDLRGRPHPWGIVVFLARFVVDLLISSVQVSWYALRPGSPPVNSIVAVRLRTRSDLVMTMTTEALSLVPGSVVIELDQATGTLYAHVIAAGDQESVERFRRRTLELEARVIRAVGDTSECAKLDREEKAEVTP